MTNNIAILLGWVSVLFLACSGNEAFTIDGQIDNAGNIKTVLLYEGDRKLDSVFLNEKGAFRFRRAASHPRLLTLEAGINRYHVILQNGDQLSFRADLTKDSDDYEISGSPLSEKIKSFAGTIAEKERFQEELETAFASQAAGLDDTALMNLRQQFLQKYRERMQQYTKSAVQFANQHDDLAGFYAMSTLDAELAETELIAYADRIAGRWDDNARVRQFLEEMARLKRLAVGQPAPDFESLTPNNQPIKLSDFKGKYTLVDFWASWCVPCREENPNIVKQYHAYKDKGFTVLGVSLDGNPGAWMRAIRDDGLEWTQVSDLQQWGSEVVGLYRIQAIPTSYLLDPQGIIIAKNLRGPDLEAFLKKTLD
ncbi:AhpC/TSA family protein [Parapedobacter sp. ISTM3]|uniref:TlpA disulfide reductase family protein n=1 Tax=Parapedobacter sp. ISTM3 TaxID=2800130 RepID=UPI00190874F6|nr:TlpA disulfide reductase family protein [Parapedobacter sp. ISTM3]MBK1438946.1 AhpC/TSA family protein [Parapedobacter sp. ISTM3]